jgi:hypothetical protein
MLQSAGADFMLGRRLPTLMEQAGLVDVRAEGRVGVSKAPATPAIMFYDQVRDKLVATGRVTQAEIDEAISELTSKLSVGIYSPLMVACIGTRA